MLPLHHDHHAADVGFAGVGSLPPGSKPISHPAKSSWPAQRPDFAAESGDDRTRTGACSPDKRVLLPLSYVPE